MGTKIFVGNLSFKTTEDALRMAFATNGRNVKSITLPSDRETGRPRGFAFIEMGSEQEAQDAIKSMDGVELDGRALRVNEAQERAPGGGGRRFGGGGGGGGGGRGGGGGGGDRGGKGDRW
jgi:RNA recognition motif-containing protein